MSLLTGFSVSAEGRAQRMVDEYSAVFDAIVMRLGVTADMVLMLVSGELVRVV